MSERQALAIRTEAAQLGDEVRIRLTVELPAGVHIEPHEPVEPYLIPTVLDVDGLTEVTVEYPQPTVKDLGWHDLTLTVLEGTLEFTVTGRLREEAARISGTLRYQPCIGGACLPPRAVPWVSPLVGTSAYSILNALAAQPA